MPDRGVLVVEDDGLVSWALQKAAAVLHVTSCVASSVAEAMVHLRSRRFELAFVDIGLPDADGVDLVPVIHDLSPDTRVVVISADAWPANRERALRAGAWHFLEKPFEMSEIARLIQDRCAQGAERRVVPRRPGHAALRLELVNGSGGLDGAFEGTLVDSSGSGLRLRTRWRLEVGQRVRVHLVPGGAAFGPELPRDGVAQVAWTRTGDDDLVTAGLSYVG